MSIPLSDWGPFLDVKLSDLIESSQIFVLNKKETFIDAIAINIMFDAVLIRFVHPEFPDTMQGEEYLQYSYDRMKKLFPYIFTDTNPLLYRRYYISRSWYNSSKNKIRRVWDLGITGMGLTGDRTTGLKEQKNEK